MQFRKSRAVWLKLDCLKPNLPMCIQPRTGNRVKPVSIVVRQLILVAGATPR
jgi:hypothetical protein